MNQCKTSLIVAASMLLASGAYVYAAPGTLQASMAAEQKATIEAKGVVLDETGQPLIGVSVMPKGANTGVATDIDGRFAIRVPANTMLVVSYIGYLPQEIKATTSPMEIKLAPNATALDELVVMGYGVQKKKLVTGATVQIKGDDISRQNTVNPIEALQSQAPGVTITQNNGFLNSGFNVQVRGIGTIGDSAPLYVIDGVANASLDGLNPSDIESIDVLKDAASAAIYGARAANGVILVTTKRGREGHSEISYDAYVGFQNLYKIPTVLNAQEYMAIQDEARTMDGLAPYNWASYIPAADLKAIQDGTWQGTNWLKEIQNKDALIQNHALGFSGGGKNNSYSMGLSYTSQDATMGVPGAYPHMQRYNVRVNNDYIMKRLGEMEFITVGETFNYKYTKTNGSFGTGGIYWNGVHNMLVMSPLMHAYNEDGSYYEYADQQKDGYVWDRSNGSNKNPISYLDYAMNQNKSKSHYLQSSFYAQIQPIKDLKFKTQFGYIYSSSDYRSYIPEYSLTESLTTTTDQVSQSMSTSYRWTWENTLSYMREFGEHHLDAVLGQSVEKWGYGLSMSASMKDSNFSDLAHAYISNVPFLTSNIISLTGSPNTPGSIASFFGRVNYNYNEKYLATVIMRADGSSVFARGHRWGYFPSFSAGWVISNEDFMENTRTWLDFLKIRASWGQNGNCSISAFQYLSRITSNNGYGGYTFGGVMDQVMQGSYAYQVVNPDLKWETQEQFDIGFDARLFHSHLGLEFDYYNRTTKDWLVTAPILASVGADAPQINGGNITNKGVEFGAHWNDNIGRDWYYGINFNIAHNKNKVTKIANAEGIIHGSGSVLWEGADECIRTAEVGMPVGYFYGYKTAGVFQNQEQIDAYQGAKLLGDKTAPGDLIWVDTNGDGVINSDDRTMIGDPHPDVTMGFSFSIGWKALDLSVNTFGAFGQQIMKCYRDFSASPNQNFTTDIFNRWHGEGTSNRYPRLSNSTSTNWNRVSDIYVENGDYLKIKNITIGYDFARQFPKMPFSQLRLYAQVQNLFTFTKYSGMDPEIGFGGESAGAYAQGIDLGYYPSSRNVLIGLNVKF
jgi:TonB-linked SusC/RagA family outer membrane protein